MVSISWFPLCCPTALPGTDLHQKKMERRKYLVLTRSRLSQSNICLLLPSNLMVLLIPCLITGQWRCCLQPCSLLEPDISTLTFPLGSSRHGSSQERPRFWGNQIRLQPMFDWVDITCLLCPVLYLWRDKEQLHQCLHSEAFSTAWKSQELHL